MPNLRPWEILIIVALILLLFGAKRLPDAARGLGRSLRIFKAETKAMHEDDAGTVDSGTGDARNTTPVTPPAIKETSNAAEQQPSTAPASERTES